MAIQQSNQISRSVNGSESDAQRRRRGELIGATIETIAEHGLSNLTLAKVAKRAGLTGAMVNFHFAGKEALLVATLRGLYEEYEGAVEAALAAAGDDPAAALEALVEAHFDPALSDPSKIAVWTAFWGEARAREDYMALCGQRDDALDQRTEALCRQVIERDGYDHLDPAAMAGGLSGLLEETWQGFLVDDSMAERAERRRLCRAYLSGIFPKSFPLETKSAESEASHPIESSDWDRSTLAPWTYRTEEFTALEKEKIFRRHWLLVGHESEAPEPGDYLTFEAVDERAVVVRGRDGVLRAFHNICRHRASKVLTERQGHCRAAMVCPFHGWSYDLNGRLKGIPAADTFGDLDAKKIGLKAIEVELWQGFVFIRFGGKGPSVAEHFGPYEAELAPYRLPELQPLYEYWQHETALDWKTVHDVDNEGYHVPIAHPGLHRLVGTSYYDEVLSHHVGRSWSILREEISPRWSEGLYQRLLPNMEHLPESHRRAWLYYAFQPNLSIAFYPDCVDFFQAFPIAPGRCLMRGRTYALPDDRREMRAVRYLNDRINKRVGEEDRDIAAWSAAGMHSSGFEGSILSDKEVGVRALHDFIRAEIPVARSEQPPAIGRVADQNRRMGG
ncbi:MAG: SRPBCC family protein [Pseudomonadota bacterium]